MNVNWAIDTAGQCDVVVEMPGALQSDGTWDFGGFQVNSPSGQWSVNSGDNVVWDPSTSSWPTINGGGSITQGASGGAPLLAFPTFHSGFTVNGSTGFMRNTAQTVGWTGGMRFWITMPVADPYTWTCRVRYSAMPT